MNKYIVPIITAITMIISSVFQFAMPVAVNAQTTTPTITLFGTKNPNPTNGSVNMSWQASTITDAIITMNCSHGSINFTTDKGNAPSCDKGGVWSWSGQTGDSITLIPSGNSSYVTVPFTLALTQNGISTGQNQTISVTFPPTVNQTPTITLFGTKNPNPNNGSVNMSWQASAPTNAILEMTCTPGSISFTTDKGNFPSCDKGGVWSWTSQTGDSITLTPSGNSNAVTVPFTLTLTNSSGVPTGQSQTISVTFPPAVTSANPTITLFGAKNPNPTDHSVNMSWQASAPADAQLDVICNPGSISFTTNEGNAPSCDKGGIWSWDNQSNGNITVYPLGNTQPVTVSFVLTLTNNGTLIGQSQTINVTFPASYQPATNPTIALFGAKDPNPLNHSVIMTWQASLATGASLDMTCTPGSISFTTDKGNFPSCDKGGVWYWPSGQTGDSITLIPSGNSSAVTVPFTLTLTQNGSYTNTSQSKTIYVTFPPTPVVSSSTVVSTSTQNPINIIPTTNQPAVNCPVGWTCAPSQQNPKPVFTCPTGWVCTPVNTTTPSISGYSGSGVGYAGISGGGYYNANNCFDYSFVNNLSIGSTGSDVTALQEWLLSKGFDMPAISARGVTKGYFGNQTSSALQQYQKSVGLTATGYLDSATMSSISSSEKECNTNTN